MNQREANDLLRNMVARLINSGWVKTKIGKILLGGNGQAHLNHWLQPNDFGVRPLSKIAELIDYDVHLVFVPKRKMIDENIDDSEKTKLVAVQKNIEQINSFFNQQNEQFCTELESALTKVLNENIVMPRMSRTHRGKIDQVLDELLGYSTEPESEKNPVE